MKGFESQALNTDIQFQPAQEQGVQEIPDEASMPADTLAVRNPLDSVTEEPPNPLFASVIAVKDTVREERNDDLAGVTHRDDNNRRFWNMAYRKEVKFKNELHAGSSQMFLSRMLKGIMPVSDVTIGTDKDGTKHFYSYEVPLDAIRDDENYSYDESKARGDALVLKHVFGDHDHTFGTSGNNVRGAGKTTVFYDFGMFEEFWSNYKWDEIGVMRAMGKLDPEAFEFVHKRLGDLIVRCGGEEGLRFLADILDSMKKSGVELPEVLQKANGGTDADKLRSFHTALNNQIEFIDSIWREMKASRKATEDTEAGAEDDHKRRPWKKLFSGLFGGGR